MTYPIIRPAIYEPECLGDESLPPTQMLGCFLVGAILFPLVIGVTYVLVLELAAIMDKL